MINYCKVCGSKLSDGIVVEEEKKYNEENGELIVSKILLRFCEKCKVHRSTESYVNDKFIENLFDGTGEPYNPPSKGWKYN